MNTTSNNSVKGLRCEVFASTYNPAARGLRQVILTGPGIPEVFEASEEMPAVRIVKRNIYGKEYLHAELLEKPAGKFVGPMAGGAFIFTSDSRFPAQYPISLHDRFETVKEYATHD